MKCQAVFPKVSVWQFLSDDCVQLGQDEVITASSKEEGMKRRRQGEQRRSDQFKLMLVSIWIMFSSCLCTWCCILYEQLSTDTHFFMVFHPSLKGNTTYKGQFHSEFWDLRFVSSPFRHLFQTSVCVDVPFKQYMCH